MLRRRARRHGRACGVGACDRSRGERRRVARLGLLARTLLLDAALWLPLAVFALLAAKVVCRRGVSSKASSAGIAAVAALAFGALLVPVAIVRQKALATGIPTLAGDSLHAGGGGVSASAWLCPAIGSSRGIGNRVSSPVPARAPTGLLLG